MFGTSRTARKQNKPHVEIMAAPRRSFLKAVAFGKITAVEKLDPYYLYTEDMRIEDFSSFRRNKGRVYIHDTKVMRIDERGLAAGDKVLFDGMDEVPMEEWPVITLSYYHCVTLSKPIPLHKEGVEFTVFRSDAKEGSR
jgi:hypothetical protein